MPSKAQLETKGRELTARLDEFESKEDWATQDERKSAFETLDAEFKSWEGELSTCEAASDMRAKMEGIGGEKEAKDASGNYLDKFDVPNPHTPRERKRIAMEFLNGTDERGRRNADKILALKDFRRMVDVHAAIETKDATEGNNVMGETLYGTSGPGAIGQNPFSSTGAFAQGIMPDWRPGIVEKLFFELTIADLISSFSTSSNNVSYLTESVANLTANQVSEGATFPWMSVEVARTYAQIGKIASIMTISDEAIADAPTLFNFVQGRLLMSLQRQEEVQILAASGYPGVGGLLSFASSFTASASSSIYGATSATGSSIAFPTSGTAGAGEVSQTISSLAYGRVVTGTGTSYPTGQQIALNLKDAFVDIELQVFQTPNAVVVNPRDWQLLETVQDANGQFLNTGYFGNVYGNSVAPVKSIWGVPVVTTPLMPKGTILTGWFDPQTVQIARRQGVQLQMTNSNSTDFENGLVAVRADERLGLLCYRPPAFQLIQLVAG